MLDVREALIGLESSGAPLGEAIDIEHGAVTGFSLGGWTAIRSGAHGPFDAVIAQAPGIRETLTDDAAEFSVPVLIMNAGEDAVVAPDSVRSIHDELPVKIPHYYLLLPGARHSSFHDICFEETCNSSLDRDLGHQLINRYAVAFLMAYLKGERKFVPVLRESVPPYAEMEYQGPR
jgi:dienelactone hydrolase